uniref:Ribonuclease H n=2 Tax=Physcomitrium patens TaxID=3218 RepID=A0A2K1K5P6_PHYPA|nr:hypothetical protein PHYPA_010999 [Physcomitrium patens]
MDHWRREFEDMQACELFILGLWMVAVAVRRACASVFSSVAILLENVHNSVIRYESMDEAPSGSVSSRKTRNEFRFESRLQKFYAVWVGFQPGIYASWEECKSQVIGFRGAQFKSFRVRCSAERYMRG